MYFRSVAGSCQGSSEPCWSGGATACYDACASTGEVAVICIRRLYFPYGHSPGQKFCDAGGTTGNSPAGNQDHIEPVDNQLPEPLSAQPLQESVVQNVCEFVLTRTDLC